MVRIEHLNFVGAHQEHAAVAAVLVVTARRIRRRPFDVQLHVAELAAGRDVTGAGGDHQVAVLDLPPRVALRGVSRPPFGERASIEQDDCVGRWRHGPEVRSRSDDRRSRPIHGVLLPRTRIRGHRIGILRAGWAVKQHCSQGCGTNQTDHRAFLLGRVEGMPKRVSGLAWRGATVPNGVPTSCPLRIPISA